MHCHTLNITVFYHPSQYSTKKQCTLTTMYYIILKCTSPYYHAHNYNVLYHTTMYCIIQQCTPSYYNVLYHTIMYFIILQFTLPYSSVIFHTTILPYENALYHTTIIAILYFSIFLVTILHSHWSRHIM